MTRWVALLCAWALPAVAQDTPDPGFPAIYTVTGVASDDALNVRAAPNVRAELLGTLAHDDDWVEVLALSREGRWAQINIGERAGWVSTRFLGAREVPTNSLGLPETLVCLGNEPFWQVRLAPSAFILSTPDERGAQPLTFVAPSPENVDLTQTGLLFDWGFSDSSVRGRILPGSCSDGMSDRRYGLHYVDPVLGHGCCSIDE
ncbi:SH3 domain-containing protein [Litoreibacter ponti]|uniref:SH3 domain-containing protein n=1 Tax=Litoreibacter ponti TaxID=1510457 RepID=A0A2T6BKP9_9RHOB|nr:SH3 domain-containing protein [Litoreibacter ponti]PTX56634.1 SH3 domain-containing protein [Litoreibacter ponti]